MSDQTGLLRGILDHPDDDVHRLVYADWLEEHGEAHRAAFIREQVALAKLPEYDAANVRYWRAFRDRNNPSYPNLPLPTLPQGLGRGVFPYRRGFPWMVQVSSLAALVREAPRLFDQLPIQALDIDARSVKDLTPLATAPWLARIVRLKFSLGEFGTDRIGQLLDSPHMGRLAELIFEFGGINAAGLRRLLPSPLATQLRVLGLRNNFFVEHGAALESAFGVASPLPALEELDLSSNRIIGAAVLRSLLERPMTPNLRKLDLSDNPLGLLDNGVVYLSRCRSLSRLEVLNLSATAPQVAAAVALFEAPFAPGLRVLRLRNNRLGPVAVKRLAAAPSLAGLRVLELGDNSVKDSGAKALAGSPHLAGLLSLDLRHCGITNAGANALLDSPTLAGLIHCDLHDNAFSRPVVKRVRERFGHFSASDPQHTRARGAGGKT